MDKRGFGSTAALAASRRGPYAPPPRVVVVTRPTELDLLLARHATRAQAAFFLGARGQSIDAVDERHHRFQATLARVSQHIPLKWRRARIDRADLSRFVFEPGDLIVAVGQDGLVPNVAKYLNGQPVIGVNPDPKQYDGVLVRHHAEALGDVLALVLDARASIEERTMAEVVLDDGQRLRALNEIFVGHRTHQSARYVLRAGQMEERQSSSGVVIATGTGATGWARSIARQRASLVNSQGQSEPSLPGPCDRALAFFVREPFPSVVTGTDLEEGEVDEGDALELTSEMNDGGVAFADGIEDDRLTLGWGTTARVGVAEEVLRLVI